jgi:hypothetical protein
MPQWQPRATPQCRSHPGWRWSSRGSCLAEAVGAQNRLLEGRTRPQKESPHHRESATRWALNSPCPFLRSPGPERIHPPCLHGRKSPRGRDATHPVSSVRFRCRKLSSMVGPGSSFLPEFRLHPGTRHGLNEVAVDTEPDGTVILPFRTSKARCSAPRR